jgi:hypothetical protein
MAAKLYEIINLLYIIDWVDLYALPGTRFKNKYHYIKAAMEPAGNNHK